MGGGRLGRDSRVVGGLSARKKAALGAALQNLTDLGRGLGSPEVLERCVAHSFSQGNVDGICAFESGDIDGRPVSGWQS